MEKRKHIWAMLLLIAIWLFSTNAFAEKVQIDGIYYNLNGDEAEVTYKDLHKNSYSGDIIIPESVVYNYTTYSVTSIGNGAFTSSGLTSITIPNSITSIKAGVFGNCTDLSSINVEAGNTIYDSRNNCNAIIETATNVLIAGCKNTIIPNSVMSIGVGAIDRCSGLTTISIPNSIINIEDYAFEGCTELTSISIPNSVTSIGMGAFYYCTKITTIFISNSVASIKDAAFCDCASLTDVYCLAENVPNTSNHVFDATTLNSATLHVPYGCKAAYEAASPWNQFGTVVEVDPENLIISFADAKVKALCVANWDTNSDGELDEAEAAAVTDLGTVFKGNTEITSFNELQYFTGLTAIGEDAFFDCRGLSTAIIPNSVTSIGEFAFQFCSVTSINIPNSVTSIGRQAFYCCTNLTSVTIPNSVTSIGDGAFSDCSSLSSVYIPYSVTSIGYEAFKNCGELTSIKVEPGNTTYDSRNNCNAIIETATNTLIRGCENTTIPNSVTIIGNYAFSGCYGLTSISISNSVTSIGDGAFYYCYGLTSVNIPNPITRIGDFAFCCCYGLTTVNIPNSVRSIGDFAFQSCYGLTSVNIPNSVTSIGRDAFDNCSGLTSVNIPNSVTSIGRAAFYRCSGLTSVTIGNSVKNIENYAFAYCSKLTDVYCYAEKVPFTESVSFEDSHIEYATLHVPYGCKAAYEAASPWNGFGEIVEMTSSITIGETGFATFCSPYALDFSEVTDIRAYIVSGFNQENGTLVLTRVTEVPAGEGLYIAGMPGNHEIPQTQTSMFYANLLKGVTEPTIISPTDGNYTNYILSNGSYGVGFYTLSTTGTLDAGKAYLQLPTASVAGIKALKIEFDENDDPTGIAITSTSPTEENTIYNLAGQRVSKTHRGINIVNGKKVFIK